MLSHNSSLVAWHRTDCSHLWDTEQWATICESDVVGCVTELMSSKYWAVVWRDSSSMELHPLTLAEPSASGFLPVLFPLCTWLLLHYVLGDWFSPYRSGIWHLVQADLELLIALTDVHCTLTAKLVSASPLSLLIPTRIFPSPTCLMQNSDSFFSVPSGICHICPSFQGMGCSSPPLCPNRILILCFHCWFFVLMQSTVTLNCKMKQKVNGLKKGGHLNNVIQWRNTVKILQQCEDPRKWGTALKNQAGRSTYCVLFFVCFECFH